MEAISRHHWEVIRALSSVWSAKEVVNKGIRWRVGDGKSIHVWRDAWVRDLPGFRVGTTPASGLDNLKVSDLLLDARRGWDSEWFTLSLRIMILWLFVQFHYQNLRPLIR